MENIKIQFKGITRNTDDGMCSDGECMELINAHIENGSVEPIGKPILQASLSREYRQIYYHASADKYIGVTEEGQMYTISSDLTSESMMSSDVAANSLSFVGNTIAVATNQGMKYFLYKQGEYVYLGTLPELPSFKIDKHLFVEKYSDPSIQSDNWATYGNYLKLVNQANKNGSFVHAAAFRAAFRLYDGTYIKHSHIRLLYLTENDTYKYPGYDNTFKGSYSLRDNSGNFNSEFQVLDRDTGIVFIGLLCFNPYFYFTDVDLNLWSDIILSIDIFATENFRLRFDVPTLEQEDTIETPYEKAIKMSDFRLITSINPYTESSNVSTDNLKDVTADNLKVQQELPDDTYSHNTFAYKHLTSYNNKLHAWGRTEYMFSWYNGDVTFDNTTLAGQLCDVYIVLQGYSKELVLKRSVNMPTKFGPYLMYPDVRAKAIVIVNNTLNKSKRFNLQAHPTLNLAFYCKKENGDFGLEDMNTWSDPALPLLTTDNIDRTDDNVLRVSKAGNPFTFPADQTYQFNSSIVGAQSNVVAMSQGQFGQFPLYVFTKEGIFVLSVGTGTVSYASQAPGPRDVCTNPDSICALDTAVAFATDKGLMIINGSQTQLISESIYGFLPSCSISSPIIPKIMEVAGMGNLLSSVTFPDYLKGAKVGYNYEAQSIIVANPEYEYSYVYSIKTNQWHKISENIKNFINAYPQTWALNGRNIYNLNNFHRTVSTIVLISRPIKMGTLTHKRIVQTALRGIVKRSLSDLYYKGEPVMFRGEGVDIFSNVGMYILGSNDAEHFSLVAKKEMMVDIRDLVTKMNKSKPYKYFMVCLVGGVRTDVSINYIEMNVDGSFTNRLR